MNTRPAPPSSPAWTPLTFIAGGVLIAALILALHGNCLDDGLFMDDWPHYLQLREAGWSLSDLTAACRLELVGGINKLWWLPECTLRFFRPVAFGLMKAVYTLGDWRPVWAHAASLGWHLTTCLLLMVLLRRFGASRLLAWIVASLYGIHPGHVASVQWIACQSELMVTVFLLGATLCWARVRAWDGFAAAPERAARLPLWAAAALVLFTLALGCRENAVMFPFVMAVMERRRVAAPRIPALPVYGAAALLLGGYFAIRGIALAGVALPPPPYIMPPTDPGFLRFVFDKAFYYLLGEFLLVPTVPIGGLPYFRAHPLAFYGLTAAIVLIFGFISRRYSIRKAGLLGPAWLGGYMLPVLPAFASPHHLYLPGIGWAIVAMLLLRRLGQLGRAATGSARHAWRGARFVFVGGMGLLFAAVTFYEGLALDTGQRVEDCIMAEITADADAIRDGDTLYVANLPIVGHYVRLGVEERTGRRDLRVVSLTWATRVLGCETPTELYWIDDRTIEVAVAEDRYFASPYDLLSARALGRPIPDVVDRLDDLGVRVEVLERDSRGIQRFRFTFARSLHDPRVHLYWGSRVRWAAAVRPGVAR